MGQLQEYYVFLASPQKTLILTGGVYTVPRGIVIPIGAVIKGSDTTTTIIRLRAKSSVTTFLVSVSTNVSLTHLVLDANNNLPHGPDTSVIELLGNYSLIADISVGNASYGIGIHVRGDYVASNHLLRVRVQDCYYGLAFGHGLAGIAFGNVFEQGVIEHVRCDGVIFAGYGELVNSTVHHLGFDCLKFGDLPQPAGAGVYCRGSDAGGLVLNSKVRNTCGMVVDSDGCNAFNLSFNTLEEPGETMSGLHKHCIGMTTVSLMDSKRFHIEGNMVANHRRSNALLYRPGRPDPHGAFADVGGDSCSDLPMGERSLLNFAITERPYFTNLRPMGVPNAPGHVVLRNTFIATCRTYANQSDDADCEGVGYFSGRGSGLQASGVPQPALFDGNLINGSDRGSVRCGENAYGVNTSLCNMTASFPCNVDDFEHPLNVYRNDPHCRHYGLQSPKEIASSSFEPANKCWRTPLPSRSQ